MNKMISFLILVVIFHSCSALNTTNITVTQLDLGHKQSYDISKDHEFLIYLTKVPHVSRNHVLLLV